MESLNPDELRVQRAEETIIEIHRKSALRDRMAERRHRSRMAMVRFDFLGDLIRFDRIEREVAAKAEEILESSYSRIPPQILEKQ